MLGYCTLGTNNLEAAASFYEPIAQILGHGRVMESDRVVMWGTGGQGAIFCVIKPLDEKPATIGNGSMFGFAAASQEQVRQIYDHALANGGSDEGAPGTRPAYAPSFYVAYVRDPDRNKLACVFDHYKPG
jgi:catechol 2,3-dioxygenase-like lactoylglutathione lyase family enzyme